MNLLLLAPVFLSLLMLGAHFVRAGLGLPALLTLFLIGALFIRRPWIVRIVQLALIGGTLEWIRTSVALVFMRQSLGLPWLRLALILGAVILLCVCSIFALESESLRERYGLR